MSLPRRPLLPTDPRVRACTDEHIRTLIAELQQRGRKFGLLFPSIDTDRTLDGRVLVCFNTAPASTLLNLLSLLLEAERQWGAPCDS
ncbi:hypothetical protein ACIQWA_31785 [Kitasatospora sp. NPDC098652]|uniref:hypothetical protein n=1 Tax=Kitasatospora sp. NPDC098652 TaxID=3364095 RepID=UPI003824F6E9